MLSQPSWMALTAERWWLIIGWSCLVRRQATQRPNTAGWRTTALWSQTAVFARPSQGCWSRAHSPVTREHMSARCGTIMAMLRSWDACTSNVSLSLEEGAPLSASAEADILQEATFEWIVKTQSFTFMTASNSNWIKLLHMEKKKQWLNVK